MFDYVGKRKIFFTISIVLVALCVVFLAVFGAHLDIQFKGGSIVTYNYSGDIDLVQVQKTIEEITGQRVSVQAGSNAATGSVNFTASLSGMQGISPEMQISITEKLNELFPDAALEVVSINNVDATIGKEFFQKSLVAMIFAGLMMIVYIGIRFKNIGGWSAGCMAMVALLHDVMVVFTVFVLFRIPINDNFIAVVLTILGCSINDTIVIYDRIRENERLAKGGKINLGELVNLSINQSLSRAFFTTLTIVMAMLVVAVIGYMYQINTIVTFAFPMVMGMISGCYSSVCLSGPLWVMWEERKSKKGAKH